MRETALIDRSVKALIRQSPPVFFKLVGVDVSPQSIHLGDVSVNTPELRADQVFIVREAGAQKGNAAGARRRKSARPKDWAMHLEYVLHPKAIDPENWLVKNTALNKQLKMPVILSALYLTRGKNRSFPDTYQIEANGLTKDHRFHTIRLWEHAERIRSGELKELAPLLVLCEDRPTQKTLQQERELILSTDQALQSDLLALAFTVGTRYFAVEVLQTVFK